MSHSLLTFVVSVALAVTRLVWKSLNLWRHCENCCENVVGKYSDLLILSCGFGLNISLAAFKFKNMPRPREAWLVLPGNRACQRWVTTPARSLVQPDPAQSKHCLSVSPLPTSCSSLTLGPTCLYSIFYDEYLWRNCDKSIDPNIFIVGVLLILYE